MTKTLVEGGFIFKVSFSVLESTNITIEELKITHCKDHDIVVRAVNSNGKEFAVHKQDFHYDLNLTFITSNMWYERMFISLDDAERCATVLWERQREHFAKMSEIAKTKVLTFENTTKEVMAEFSINKKNILKNLQKLKEAEAAGEVDGRGQVCLDITFKIQETFSSLITRNVLKHPNYEIMEGELKRHAIYEFEEDSPYIYDDYALRLNENNEDLQYFICHMPTGEEFKRGFRFTKLIPVSDINSKNFEKEVQLFIAELMISLTEHFFRVKKVSEDLLQDFSVGNIKYNFFEEVNI